MRLIVGICIAIYLMAVGPSFATPFKDGVAAQRRGDYVTAMRLWRPLADQGDAAAQYNVGLLYFNGHGVPQDFGEAVKWFHRSAAQSYARAKFYLGLMHYNGQGVERDYIAAYMWWSLAAAKNVEGAANNRDVVGARMTAAEIAEAQRRAREWTPR